MKKMLISLLIISTISCAAIREYRAEYKAELAAEDRMRAQSRPAQLYSSPVVNDSTLGLLLGLYTFSLIKSGGPAYYAPSYCTYLSPSAYCPPDVWAAWTPLERSLWIEYNLDLELSRYESRLKDINNMEMFKLQTEVQRLIDKINREKKD